MTQEQQNDEQAKQEDQAATAVLGPPNSEEDLCGSCGGLVVTVVFGSRDRPEIGCRLWLMGRGLMGPNDDRGCNPAHTPLRHAGAGAGHGAVSGCQKIRIICGGCGRRLFLFEGGGYLGQRQLA
jgi:hypothetical protein